MYRLIFRCSLVCIAALCISGCGGGGSSTEEIDDIAAQGIPDPIEPLAVDVTISGTFEGEEVIVPADIEPEPPRSYAFRDAETNSLSAAQIAAAPDFDLESFAQAFEQVRAAQPALPTSSNAFAQAIITSLLQVSRTAASNRRDTAQAVYDTFDKLTPAEKALVLLNPVKGYKSRTAASDAVTATNTLFTGSAYLTRADAFRHSYWNWLMSECCGVAWANSFATAHESEVPNNDDKRMDLNNNMVGRRLFLKNPGATREQAQEALLDYPLLWINSKLKNVTVGIDYLVYLAPEQTLTVFDDGPSYDDIYTVSIASKVVGDTPEGSSRAFEFDQIPSGTHPVSIFCKLDGTRGGCGFQIQLQGASQLPDGSKGTSQITIQEGGTHNTTFKFSTMKEVRED